MVPQFIVILLFLVPSDCFLPLECSDRDFFSYCRGSEHYLAWSSRPLQYKRLILYAGDPGHIRIDCVDAKVLMIINSQWPSGSLFPSCLHKIIYLECANLIWMRFHLKNYTCNLTMRMTAGIGNCWHLHLFRPVLTFFLSVEIVTGVWLGWCFHIETSDVWALLPITRCWQ